MLKIFIIISAILTSLVLIIFIALDSKSESGAAMVLPSFKGAFASVISIMPDELGSLLMLIFIKKTNQNLSLLLIIVQAN